MAEKDILKIALLCRELYIVSTRGWGLKGRNLMHIDSEDVELNYENPPEVVGTDRNAKERVVESRLNSLW